MAVVAPSAHRPNAHIEGKLTGRTQHKSARATRQAPANHTTLTRKRSVGFIPRVGPRDTRLDSVDELQLELSSTRLDYLQRPMAVLGGIAGPGAA